MHGAAPEGVERDSVLRKELSHRGKTRAVLVARDRLWTAGEKNLREWDITMPECDNTQTWPLWPSAGIFDSPEAEVTCLALVGDAQLWCGMSNGAVRIFHSSTGTSSSTSLNCDSLAQAPCCINWKPMSTPSEL